MTPLLWGSPWNCGIALGLKTRMMELLGLVKKCNDIYSCFDTIHHCDRQADGRAPTVRTALDNNQLRQRQIFICQINDNNKYYK